MRHTPKCFFVIMQRGLSEIVLWLLVILVTSSIIPSVGFGQAFKVKLSRPDSFIGWEYSASTEGWRIADGRFVGEAPAAELLSGWTFGQFDLRLRWSVGRGAAAAIVFPEVGSGESLRLVLSTDEICGRLSLGEQELAPGRNLGIKPGRANKLRLTRQDDKLTVAINDQVLYEVQLPATKRFGLALQVEKGEASFWGMEVEELGASPMFNQLDFTGWYTKGDIQRWRYENGEVVLAGRAGDYLRTEKLYGNFTWFLEYKMQKGGNSGLGLRTPHEGWPTADGMELQLLDTPYDAEIRDQPMMAIYGHVPPLSRADRSEMWNRVVVKAEGYMISAWVNGELVQHANTFYHPELRHRPLEGWLGFQDHGAWIRVRNVSIIEAPPGLGLESWYKPQTLPPIAEILDRLINPERLCRPTSLTTERIFAAVVSSSADLSAPSGSDGVEQAEESRSEQKKSQAAVLLDAPGPAVLTGITHFGGKCKLHFYLDGDSQPRIEATVDELAEKLPVIGKERSPFLLCLPFARRLRIEATEAEPSRFYFDVIRVGGGRGVESFSDIKSSFPRGWFDCVNAILRWLGSGRYQEYSPYERSTSSPTGIGPGESKRLLSVEGGGIVRALKLEGSRRVLENNDLWLQIYVDGQRSASVEAPIRFLFPALTRNYPNFVLADQRGLTIFLPIPFRKGLEVVASNRGGRTIPDLALSVTIDRGQRIPYQEMGEPMRLRARFLPAQTTQEFVQLRGRGRLIGFVYEVPPEGDSGIYSLVVDGRPVDGWSCDSLDALVGRSGDFRTLLSGRQGVLCWRFFHLNPIDYRESLVITMGGNRLGARLVWYYSND
jgi:hypothetical protein